MGLKPSELPSLKKPGRGMEQLSAKKMKTTLRNCFPKKPHFNFIVAHYVWIVSMTIFASILIYATAGGRLAYVDALFFASGANTQAGLNTVDVNLLNTFQQVVIYLCAMTSNPITIHASVVFLRLYWFEKRFQNLVRDARTRRATVTKSKSKAKNDLDAAERGGVNGRNITVMRNKTSRITNDGIVLENEPTKPPPETIVEHSNETDSTKGSVSDESGPSTGTSSTRVSPEVRQGELAAEEGTEGKDQLGQKQEQQQEQGQAQGQGQGLAPGQAQPSGISFAPTVKRSDGVSDDQTKFNKRSPEEHFAILQDQREIDTDNDEILRIPNPRDAERGIGPQRVLEEKSPDAEDGDDHDGLEIRVKPRPRTDLQSTPSAGHITIQEPETKPKAVTTTEPEPVRPPPPQRKRSSFRNPLHRRKRDDIYDEARAISNTFGPLSFRMPRLVGGKTDKVHHDDDRPQATRSRTFMDIKSALSRDKANQMPYLSWTPTEMGRNSQFTGLTLEQREELGGIEYRSLRTLALLLVCYFWGWSIFAVTCLMPYIHRVQKYGEIVEAAGVSRTWWGFFTSNSAFMDLGFTLTPDSMSSFQESSFVLLVMWFLIIIGNSGFPVMLRFCIWVLSFVVPQGSGFWEELKFLLDHPRRCFTLLFPAGATWWLFWILIALNGIDVILFVILDLDAKVLESLNVGERIVNGMFVAASTRTAGFSSVSLSALHPAVQTSYMIMMYISVFPIAMSIRRTNVYEEKSLGIDANTGEEVEQLNDDSAMSHLGSHLRRQLSFDLWFVFICLFILGITEGGAILRNEFNMFAVLFECVSAYGTVGLSLGVPNVNASLCSQFSTLGKLIIIAMQIRGRHRGLPYGLDRAILLPSEARFQMEAELPAHPVLSRTNTAYSTGMSPLARKTDSGMSLLKRRSTVISDGLSRTGTSISRNLAGMLMPGPPLPPRHKAQRSVDRRMMSDEDEAAAAAAAAAEGAGQEVPRRVMSGGAGPSSSMARTASGSAIV